MVISRISVRPLHHHARLAVSTTKFPAAVAGPRSFSGTRRQQTYEDDMSGQEVPRSKSPAVEALRKNWVPIGGTALIVGAAYAYFAFPKANKDKIKEEMFNAETKSTK
ncbi:hypothetical protein VFPPC_00188 [Pochonia chlamydosporia 170]|uniref:Uncharacterized protein n=1 Tax=Pochonia chlamydosporia 170 TaxID=1380566 RepID=A0A179G3R4_METCM|nr:hypothetical protein VFPPC_00188 [Pochonia chlamydosporia 170]OAQ72140.1 hypothetical protein VFPPC_00188 [Pochonia chlamydosporia 170]